MSTHETYMKRCLELASTGLGNVRPNPMVGCVIVHDGKVIGEGYHREYGRSHAEPNAVSTVKDRSLLVNSTLYVNLEPCSVYSNTPPCSELIIEHRIPRVVFGSRDTNSSLDIEGIEKLRAAGCTVTEGILEDKCRELNRRFFTYQEKKRPYIILKWAQTADGYIDRKRTANGKPAWITNETCRKLVHKWRSEEHAIMVGTNTAKLDNPHLNVRHWEGNDPIRMTFDREGRLSPKLHLFDGSQETIVFGSHRSKPHSKTTVVQIDFEGDVIQQVKNYLFDSSIQSVLVEGGAGLLNSFLAGGHWDEARVFIGNQTFGEGVEGPQLPHGDLTKDMVGEVELLTVRNS